MIAQPIQIESCAWCAEEPATATDPDGLPVCRSCFRVEWAQQVAASPELSAALMWDAATIADVRFHEMRDEGEI